MTRNEAIEKIERAIQRGTCYSDATPYSGAAYILDALNALGLIRLDDVTGPTQASLAGGPLKGHPESIERVMANAMTCHFHARGVLDYLDKCGYKVVPK